MGLGGGEFLVAWLDTRPTQCWPGAPQVIKGRIIRATERSARRSPSATSAAGGKGWPLLASAPGRGFLAHWYEAGRGYLVRPFDRQGVPTGPDTFVIPPLASNEHVGGIAMATDGSGNLVVVWDRVFDLSTLERPYDYERT